MPVKPQFQPPSHPKAIKSSTARRQYQRQQRTQREQFTPAQIRQIEREQAQLEKARERQEKERKRKIARRKKEEKETKEREERRRLVREGKLKEEDVWGKCAASQQRLNAFFGGLAGRKRKFDESEDTNYGREGSIASAPAEDTKALDSEEIDREPFSSSAPNTMTGTSKVDGRRELPKPATKEDGLNIPDTSKQLGPGEGYKLSQPLDPSLPGSLDFDILDDADLEVELDKDRSDSNSTRQTPPSKDTTTKASTQNTMPFSSPIKPGISPITSPSVTSSKRAVFSEMTPSKINIRASEKPDVTSVAPPGSSLPSPSPEKASRKRACFGPDAVTDIQNAAQVLAMICSQDFKEDNEMGVEEEDKENKDPWNAVSKTKAEQECSKEISKENVYLSKAKGASTEPWAKAESSKRARLNEDEEADTDYEDILDYENVSDFEDDQVDAIENTTRGTESKRPGSREHRHFAMYSSIAECMKKLAENDNEEMNATDRGTSAECNAGTSRSKHTMVDAQGSPRKPKAIASKALPPLNPPKFAATDTTPLSAKSQSPPRKASPAKKSTESRLPKNEFSSFGLDGLDEDDFYMMAKTVDEAERRSSGKALENGKEKMTQI